MSNPSPSLKIGTPSRAWRSRADAWEFLGYALRQLASARHQEPGLLSQIDRSLALLAAVEPYWAEPGVNAVAQLRPLIDDGEPQAALQLLGGLSHLPLASSGETVAVQRGEVPDEEVADQPEPVERPRFEVLVVDAVEPEEAEALKNTMAAQRRPSDVFTYTVNVVPSYEDALVAIMLNPDIQSVVLRPGFSLRSSHLLGSDLQRFLARHSSADLQDSRPIERILALADAISGLRPELDVYLVAGVSIESLAGSLTRKFRRIFRRQDHLDLHLSVLSGVAERYETPFFTALQDYSRRPASVFHALPISRGASVGSSPWIRDMADFYGTNLLLAETSATSGGLDSLLDPHGSIKRAQELAARAFGAQRTYFVTNGTSTANKIVHQSLLAPGDVVLVDRNCHKSHHYAFVLAGARVSYLDAYPLDKYAFYGAVPLASLKRRLLEYRRAGRLHEVKMVTLTNCTFDGVVYDVARVMEECLAIKPDLVFLWDEAWFAFARSHPVYRRRTGMAAAAALEASFRDPAYAERYSEQAAALHDPVTGEPVDDEAWLNTRLVPDPTKVRIRVYSTQSTHKTLTSLRQGSMIHVYDQDFAGSNRESFREAYMTHTSTSPNYQILASLDIGRRQVELEGFGLVQRQSDLAVSVAQAVARHPLLKKYFRVLSSRDLIGPRYRETGSSMPLRDGLSELEDAWQRDEFVIDPSRLTLDISKTGIDGDTFRHSYLMDDHGIQVNKTSRNTVLFMTNIGTSRSSVAYLIEVLVKLAEGFENPHPSARARTLPASSDAPRPTPPLPDFSTFAARFRTDDSCEDGDIRAAYFESYKPDSTVYLSAAQVASAVAEGQEVISAGFVTPYPPGFPILVPGQVITRETLEFMAALDTREIHGFDHERGYRVFAEPASSCVLELVAVAS
ncbi:aminotransferase class I/II-fold pyridoxal phosphate-dependent enzyme [Paenarthrobacter sp. GOM3]|uniref:aminotransferase class I/II-fold pyridoxal phosphate-dependent enzyme n=1 Tax=Paenarthrobacter sp. GOM3 TaxID=2782567 RepID=UPI001BABF5A1|nr:aminotransferase class I/II-fold pyridoxal phosphate-dependent enzyme [Paenarthrobacter sp. GOM3]WOH17728.1 aminotransferase class I/II-fold pyridoxal phosphate-dependent enzyme [Paenarthrobacter sp. GOM3]